VAGIPSFEEISASWWSASTPHFNDRLRKPEIQVGILVAQRRQTSQGCSHANSARFIAFP
jgi:hypothetical protein